MLSESTGCNCRRYTFEKGSRNARRERKTTAMLGVHYFFMPGETSFLPGAALQAESRAATSASSYKIFGRRESLLLLSLSLSLSFYEDIEKVASRGDFVAT